MPNNPYHVRLTISQYGEQFRAELFTEDLGDTDGDLLPVKWEVLDEWLPYLVQGAASLPPEAARKLGQKLFEYVLGQAENSKKWIEILEQAKRQDRPLRLLIDAATDAVRDLPYGLICEPHENYFLFRPGKGRPPIQFVRILRRCTPRLLWLKKPIRILLAAAEPRSPDVPSFGCARWLCELARGLADSFEVSVCAPSGAQPIREAVPGPVDELQPSRFEPLCRTTRNGLRSALKDGDFDILHLLAHGHGNGVLLCDPAGGRAEVMAGELGEWCGASKLQMAFLEVCKAGQSGERGAFGGLAQQLLNPKYGNLAAVVASPYPLDAERSTLAAIAFYQHLARGDSPDVAIDRSLEETNWTWAFLELWVRPSALADTGTRGAFQFVSPYRGLASFQERDADIFFGREAEVAELLQILRDEPVVAVVGDSGSGKSSLLQAGLAHAVRQQGLAGRTGWRIVSLRPGNQPARSLLASLLSGGEEAVTDLPAPADWLRALTALLETTCSAGQPLLLLFDQFEEMFNLCQDVAQRRAVAEALAAVVQQSAGHFRLVLGMRSDYLGSAAALPGLIHLVKRPWVLRPPGPDDIRAIVAKPAERSGYTFQGSLNDGDPRHQQSLLERILSDPLLAPDAPKAGTATVTSPQVATPLPLMEFALERLWLKAMDRASQEFTHADYDQLGGLGGAIAQHAEEVYQSLAARPELGTDAQNLAERAFTGVISSRGTRRPRPRNDLEDELATETGDRERARRVLDALVGERLLTIRSNPDNLAESQVEIAHEVLIDRWDRLSKWLTEDPESRALREEFQPDAKKWDQGLPVTPAHSRTLLPGADTAKRYLAWIDRRSPTLSPEQSAFAAELRDMLRRQRMVLRAVAGTMTVLLGTILLLSVWAELRRRQVVEEQSKTKIAVVERQGAEKLAKSEKQRAVEQERIAEAQPLISKAAVAIDDNFQQGAALWRAEALVLVDHPGREAEDFAGRLRVDRMEALQRALVPVETSSRRLLIGSLAYSPDGKYLLSGDHVGDVQGEVAIRVWDRHDGTQVRAFVGHAEVDEPQGSTVRRIVFRPGRSQEVVSVGLDGTIRRWDWLAGKELAKYPSDVSPGSPQLLALDVSPDPGPDGGCRIITGDVEGKLVWRELDGFRKVAEVDAHKPKVNAVRFHPRGHQCASAGADGLVRLWDRDGKPKADLALPDQKPGGTPTALNDLAYSPDGKQLAAGGTDGLIYLWDTESRKLIHKLQGHERGPDGRNWIFRLVYSPSQRLFSSGTDGTIREWDTATGKQVAIRGRHDLDLFGQRVVASLAIGQDGREIASSGSDGTVRLWDAESGKLLARLEGCKQGTLFSCTASAFCAEKNLLITAGVSRDALLRSWDTHTLKERKTFVATQRLKEGDTSLWSSAVAVHPQGHQFVVGLFNGDLQLWEIETGKLLSTIKEAHKHSAHPLLADERLKVTVGGLAWSPDGRRVASVGLFDHRVKLWDPTTGERVKEWSDEDPEMPNPGPLELLANTLAILFSKDNKQLVTAGRDGIIRLWDVETGNISRRLQGHTKTVHAVTVSSDGRLLASGSEDGLVLVWDWEKRTPLKSVYLRSLMGENRFGVPSSLVDPLTQQQVASQREMIQSLAFSHDARLLAASQADGTVSLVDLATGKPIHRGVGHKPATELMTSSVDVGFTRDGTLLTVGSDGTIHRWNLLPPSEGVRRIGGRNARRLAIAPDGAQWAAITDLSKLVRWDTRSGEELGESLQWPLVVVNTWPKVLALTYSPRENKLVICVRDIQGGKAVGKGIVIDRKNEEVLATFQPPRGPHKVDPDKITAVAIDPTGTLAATNWDDDGVDLWNVSDGKLVRTLKARGGRACSLAFRPQGGRQLAMVSENGTLSVWDLTTSKEAIPAAKGPMQNTGSSGCLVYSPNGERLVQTGLGGEFVIWDAGSGRKVQSVTGHLPVANSLDSEMVIIEGAAFSPDGRWLATCGDDGTVRLWDPSEKYKPVAVLSTIQINSYGWSQLRDAASRLNTAGPLPEGPLNGSLACVAFSADGRQIITAGWDSPLRVFEIDTILADLKKPADRLLADTERLTGLRRQDNGLVPIERNHLVPVITELSSRSAIPLPGPDYRSDSSGHAGQDPSSLTRGVR